MPKLVSVIVPAYNAVSTIRDAVSSALGQSTPPSEIIVVCDGCTDDTAVVARECGATVVEIEKANGSVARNVGARRSFGDTLFFLDADDWWEKEKIASHLRVWDSFEASFVIDRSRPVLPSGEAAHWTGGIAETRQAAWREFLSYRSWASGSSFSVSRRTFEKIGGFNERLNKFQDVDFWVRASHGSGEARTIGECFTNYRLSDSPTVSKGTSFLEENLETLFAGWPFASEQEKDSFRSHAYLTAAEVTPWPQSVEYFTKAHWPLTRRFFWKSLLRSFSSRGAA